MRRCASTAEPFAILCAITIVLALLVWLRFRALARRGFAVPDEEEPAPTVQAPGIAGAFVAEWRRVLGDRGVFGLFVLAPVLYAVFYPQPYLGQIVRNIPIAVVDQDNSELSRGLIQALGAHGNLSIALRATSYREAEDAIFARRAFAIVGIPPDTETQRTEGRRGTAADLCRFDLLHPVQPHAAGHPGIGAGLCDRRHSTRGARAEGAGVQAAAAARAAGRAGHGAAVQPDRLLFQLRRAGRLRADPAPDPADGRRDAGRRRLSRQGGTAARADARLGRGDPRPGAGALDDLRAGDAALFRGHAAGLRLLDARQRLADRGACPFPFILATSFLGQALGLVFRHRETAVLLVLATSLPQFFLVGVSWPAEAHPVVSAAARASCCRASTRSTASCGSTRWGRASRRCGRTGSAVGTDAAVFRHGRYAARICADADTGPCAAV